MALATLMQRGSPSRGTQASKDTRHQSISHRVLLPDFNASASGCQWESFWTYLGHSQWDHPQKGSLSPLSSMYRKQCLYVPANLIHMSVSSILMLTLRCPLCQSTVDIEIDRSAPFA